ncbi:MAG: queuosine precursor transporter [Flavobacterium sp.]
MYIILSGIFITNAIVAELIGGKLIDINGVPMSIGILPWPIVFITTDLINEYYGKQEVKKLSILTAVLIAYTFLVLHFAIQIPSSKLSSVSTKDFNSVFGQSQLIIIGSIVAFLVSQLIDTFIFHLLKNKTGEKLIWLRSTGSTIISQLFDTFIVLGIAFYLPGIMDIETYIESGFTGYSIKLLVAVAMTPILYLGHFFIDKYLLNNEN